ncbi:right-handed parallel beta-helix repeat-containing protein [Pedobacter immunditicola]|uniref:right-handed parallel beta-helix repeat-containing protein n=1 Tax=Pedobacter immunditicola TaxID=3133440 RepID=UPI003096C771
MKVLFVFLALFIHSYTNVNAGMIKYVAPVATGDGSGKSATHAADFLNHKFWSDVQTALNKQPVTVKFLGGNYLRAYTEKPLVIEKMGHPKNLLLLEGTQSTLFTVPTGYPKKSVLIDLRDAENIKVKGFHFTGNGSLGYALRVTSTSGNTTKNILIEDCTWLDMRGIIYGATGAHQKGTSNVTYRNCTFKRVGVDSHSHFMYHSYHASNIQVLNCHFEDCTGDYVRFRSNCDYGTVKGSTFVRNADFPAYPFISVPLFNNIDPGDETFATNYTFTGNTFINTKNAIAFHHYGFDPAGLNYLLTESEGNLLTKGTDEQKRKLLSRHFKINLEKVKVSNNNYAGVIAHVVVGSFPKYGAKTKGWSGWADLSSLIK